MVRRFRHQRAIAEIQDYADRIELSEQSSWKELTDWAASLPNVSPQRNELSEVVDHVGALVGGKRWSRLCQTPLLVLGAITAVDRVPPDSQAIAFAEFTNNKGLWHGRLSEQVRTEIALEVEASSTAVALLLRGLTALESFPWSMAAGYLRSLGALAMAVAAAAPDSLQSIQHDRASRIVGLVAHDG